MTVGELKERLEHISPGIEIKVRTPNGDGPWMHYDREIKDTSVKFPANKPVLIIET